jgi:hypothetical protein
MERIKHKFIINTAKMNVKIRYYLGDLYMCSTNYKFLKLKFHLRDQNFKNNLSRIIRRQNEIDKI